MQRLIPLSLALLAACCARQTPPPQEATEAAFRALLTQNPSGVEAYSYCFALYNSDRSESSDPPQALIDHLATIQPGVQPYSHCHLLLEYRLLDSATTNQAMVLTIDDRPRSEGDTIVYHAQYYCGLACGGQAYLRVWLEHDGWRASFTSEIVF